MLHNNVEVYQDDSILWSKANSFTSAENMHALVCWNYLERLFLCRLVPSWSKCKVAKPELEWCGRLITCNVDEARSFWHMAAWHAQFIPRFGEVIWPITECLRNCRDRRMAFKVAWTAECTKAFSGVIGAICSAAELHRDGPGVYHIKGDSSEHQGGGYIYRTWGKEEARWSIPKKELYVMALLCQHFRYLVQGRKCILYTDCKSWKDLNLDKPTGRVARWLLEILEIGVDVESIPGVDNVVADALVI
jgi:hypothetical protein